MTTDEVKAWEDKTVVLYLYDGEVTTVKVDFVDDEYQDVVATVLSSNRSYDLPEKRAYSIRACEIERIEPHSI